MTDRETIISIQKKIGVVPDGIWGKKSEAALESLLPAADLSKWKLVPELEEKARIFLIRCSQAGHDLFITQGFRTAAQQAALYAQGRTAPGSIVTNAKPGQSYHETGRAFDIAFRGAVPYPSDDSRWKSIADIGRLCGLVPGYYFAGFQDKPHFQI